ncbi:MAG TPA: MFS transporter [Vicinamibacterales bacterium]|nr:MFS transporter [Vicinamibacterales bacterium]
MKTVDVGAVIDEGRWTGYQKLLIFGTALTIILDGVDNQLLPNAVPALIKEWGRPRADFINALALGPFGMMIGGLLGGILGDRIGRRSALLASVLTFAVVTLAIAFVDTIAMLGALRFLAGVGLGGAMPNAATLASEYVPARRRPFAVTLTIVCIPLGGALAGELAARVIPGYGWRTLFIFGGIIPIVLALVLWKVLPESPRYMARRRNRWAELTRTMRRIGHDIPDDVEYTEAAASGAPVTTASIGSLFAPGLARDTLALCASFFFCLMVNYVVILLLPAMLTADEVGFAQPAANRALAISNYGGVAGAILGALVIQRLGSRVAMLGMSAGAIVCAVVLTGTTLDPQDTLFLMTMILLSGALLNGVQTTMYALAAHVFPTNIRSTGVGTAVAVGRVGNVLAAYVGEYSLRGGGPPGYFTSIAVLMGVVLLSLAMVRRHVPRTSGVPALAAAGVPGRR